MLSQSFGQLTNYKITLFVKYGQYVCVFNIWYIFKLSKCCCYIVLTHEYYNKNKFIHDKFISISEQTEFKISLLRSHIPVLHHHVPCHLSKTHTHAHIACALMSTAAVDIKNNYDFSVAYGYAY